MSMSFLFLLQPKTSLILLLFTLFRIQGDASSPAAVAGSVAAGPLTGMEFAYIPSGNFLMGSPASEGIPENEQPQHSVEISAFEIMTTEVTQGMWEDVMGETAFENRNMSVGEGEEYPMYHVTWNDCEDFIQRLNDIDHFHHYRLPSESEWEYACRAGTTTRFYWGDDVLYQEIDRYSWYDENSHFGYVTGQYGTRPVGTKEPNAWGLYDMSGNVWEWCQDYYHDSYNDAPDDGSAWDYPVTSYPVQRGGCWYIQAEYSRSASRYYSNAASEWNTIGFRLVRSAK